MLELGGKHPCISTPTVLGHSPPLAPCVHASSVPDKQPAPLNPQSDSKRTPKPSLHSFIRSERVCSLAPSASVRPKNLVPRSDLIGGAIVGQAQRHTPLYSSTTTKIQDRRRHDSCFDYRTVIANDKRIRTSHPNLACPTKEASPSS